MMGAGDWQRVPALSWAVTAHLLGWWRHKFPDIPVTFMNMSCSPVLMWKDCSVS